MICLKKIKCWHSPSEEHAEPFRAPLPPRVGLTFASPSPKLQGPLFCFCDLFAEPTSPGGSLLLSLQLSKQAFSYNLTEEKLIES